MEEQSKFESFAQGYLKDNEEEILNVYDRYAGLKDGAEWADSTAWKPAAGDILPEIDREVVALVEENGLCKVVIAHRPLEHWNGKNLSTGEITTYTPKRYGKGGWNQPNVKWWLDLEFPKTMEG